MKHATALLVVSLTATLTSGLRIPFPLSSVSSTPPARVPFSSSAPSVSPPVDDDHTFTRSIEPRPIRTAAAPLSPRVLEERARQPIQAASTVTPAGGGRVPLRTPVAASSSPVTTSTHVPVNSPPASSSAAVQTPLVTTSSATATSSSVVQQPSNTPTYDPNSFIGLSLSAHNDERAKHGAAPLIWNNTLANAAQTWANNCVFQHSQGSLPIGQYGENLAAIASSGTVTAADEVALWNAEAPDYTPSNPNYSHWTQVVWKSTTQVGCAIQSCAGIFPANYPKAQYYVCEYQPPGNVYPASNFLVNVQP